MRVSIRIYIGDINNSQSSDQITTTLNGYEILLKQLIINSVLKDAFRLCSRDVQPISKTEYKKLVDQTIEVYRLKDKVIEMEKMDQLLKAKVTEMKNALGEKMDENKRLRNLVKLYERRAKKHENNYEKQRTGVRNFIEVLLKLYLNICDESFSYCSGTRKYFIV